MTTDAPHGDLPVEEERWDGERIREYEASHVARGRTVLVAGAVTDGRLVAFTELQVPLAQPERANQAGTLVLREHRGHRLGALMKAAVIRELVATMPEVRRITTYNHEDNAPMVAVNVALGFRPAGQLSTWSQRLGREAPVGRPFRVRPRAPGTPRYIVQSRHAESHSLTHTQHGNPSPSAGRAHPQTVSATLHCLTVVRR